MGRKTDAQPRRYNCKGRWLVQALRSPAASELRIDLHGQDNFFLSPPNFRILHFQTGIVEVVKLFACGSYKCLMGRVEGTF